MTADRGESASIAASDNRRKRAPNVAGFESGSIQETGNEMIKLSPWVRHTHRRYHHHQHLQQFERSGARAEREHVFVAAKRIRLRQALNVFRVVQESLALDRNEPWIVLPKAHETGTACGGHVRAEVGALQALTARHLDSDSAIDYRNEVSIGD
jgi:hypothetical protein